MKEKRLSLIYVRLAKRIYDNRDNGAQCGAHVRQSIERFRREGPKAPREYLRARRY